MNLIPNTFPLRILNIDSLSLDRDWNYKNTCSPFFRIYYVFDGEGYIDLKSERKILTPGKLYLIPNYTTSSSFCESSLSLTYVIFTYQLYNEMNIYNLKDQVFEVDATPEDRVLFNRLLQLNPDIGLVDNDPDNYDNWNYLNRINNQNQTLQESLESLGILMQLLSRFKTPEYDENALKNSSVFRLYPAIKYINNNLEKSLSVESLAKEINISTDYFSRLFLETTKSRPIEFIQRKRIERVQLLLATTDHSLDKIAELTGLNSISYLSRLFKRYTGKTTREYKRAGFK